MSDIKEVVVVGGGIGGLAAAVGLAKIGLQVTVMEQAPEFGEVGAGLQIAPNGLRALDSLGVLEQVYKKAVFPRRHVYMDAIKGGELKGLIFGEEFHRRYGYPYIVIHRRDLHDCLLEACRSNDNITLMNNHKLIDIKELEEYVQLTFENGKSYKADLVIGADGIKSKVRKLLIDDEPVPSGCVAYRFSVPMEELTIKIDWDEKYTWIGPGIHVVMYPVRSKSIINHVAVFKSYKFEQGEEEWGTRDEFEYMFKNVCPTLKESLKFADRSLITKMYDRNPIQRWSTKRVTLLGDAAHAMLQYLAQGACQALEDAVVLSEKLSIYKHDRAKALDEYQRERIPRATKVQQGARFWGEVKHASDPITIALRNELFRMRNDDDYKYVDWLYDETNGVSKKVLSRQV